MLKPVFLILISCLGVSGCTALTSSDTWSKVMRVRPDSYSDQEDNSGAYAAKLHGVLKAASVEHKVVTYEYHYTTFFREEAVGTHTAVLYRDNSDPKNPWWLMEDRLAKPVWVSGKNPEDQVAFYVYEQAPSEFHREVAVVNEEDFPAGADDHKDTVGIARTASGYERGGAPGRVRLRSEPSAHYFEVAAALPPAAVREDSYAALFRSVNGTGYNPGSALDRRKMAMLKNDAARHRKPLVSQSF